MLDDLKYIHQRDHDDMLGLAAKHARELSANFAAFTDSWSPVVPTKANQAKQLALELIGKSVVIYAGPILLPAAQSWKQEINRRAKHVAWLGQLDVVEMTGWTKQPIDKLYAVVELRSSFDDARTKNLFEAANQLLSGARPAAIPIEAQGITAADQLAWAQMLGDFTSTYLALLNNIDPAATGFAQKLLQRIGE